MANILTYLRPEEVVKITLEGIDKDLRYMDSLFLFITTIGAYLLLSQIQMVKLKYFNKKERNSSKAEDYESYLEKNSELNILGFKINRNQIMYILVLTTLFHLSLGITIKSKTNLIIEYYGATQLPEHPIAYPSYSTIDSLEKTATVIKKQIAENYAFQSLSNSLLFQNFNSKKMYLTRVETSSGFFNIINLLVLSIPAIIFTLFFLTVGFEWVLRVNKQSQKRTLLAYKLVLICLVYSMNIYSFYLWIGGIKNVASIPGFNYGWI